MALEREITYVLKVRDEASGALSKFKGAAIGATAALLGIGLITKQAIDFESAFAGVIKTVDEASDDFGNLTDVGRELREGFLDLSTIIPISANELAGVGEAAGQLGIQSENIIGFTRVMAELGVATELSSKEAAIALARFATITQLPADQFENLGSTIVDLGNNLATTEPEIVEMGLRIAGAGALIGLSQAEILGFSAALSSLGIRAQAGGTAISRTFIDIAEQVETSGENLAEFAKVSGVSIDEFQRLFKDDAAEAVLLFVEGLSRLREEGGGIIGTLKRLGLSGIRVRDTLLRMSGSGDQVRIALNRANQAFEENTATQIEVTKRFKTTESQIDLVKNRVNVLAVRLGDALLPSVIKIAEALTPAINAFANWARENEKVVRIVLSVIAVASALTIVFFGIVAALIPVLVIFGALFLAGGLVVAQFAAIIAAGVLFFLFWDDFVEAGIRALQSFSNDLGLMVEKFVEAFGIIEEFVGGVIDGLREKFEGFVTSMIDKLTRLASRAQRIATTLTGGGIATGLGQAARRLFDKREHGGFTRAPFTLVGEGGPEIVSLPRGSFVTPAAETRDILETRQNNVTINLGGVTLREEADEDRLVEKIARSIQLQSLASA